MFLDLLRKRRSIRNFTDKPIDDSIIAKIKETLLRSPSSRGINPWNFILVSDRSTLHKLSFAKEHGSGFLSGATGAVVITADENESDVWVEDCAIAAINVQLLATDLGLGSCWAQIRNRNHSATESSETYIRKLLDIPEHFRVGMIIGIGYPDESPLPVKTLDDNKIWNNRFGST